MMIRRKRNDRDIRVQIVSYRVADYLRRQVLNGHMISAPAAHQYNVGVSAVLFEE